MKQDGLLGLNRLKGKLGDKLNAVLAGIGQNCRKILAQLRLFHAWILYQLLAAKKRCAITKLSIKQMLSLDWYG
ncbi:hypothetical protein CEX98_07145 [Pseudoalteromonas piscicida]|uniref:Transposase DDE domain-containing protein n=1 Tax=Pseudoalteromonas piscicida TaxID=43662 RepID=A0A2A5JSZ5_PSEO7|nr:hypothetical protein CEX98_07145 [Pseudoalteromonas piscicida]